MRETRQAIIWLAVTGLAVVQAGPSFERFLPAVNAQVLAEQDRSEAGEEEVPVRTGPQKAEQAAKSHIEARFRADLEVLGTFRPAYEFWQHIFAIPDGRIVVGSARDGRLLATFRVRGDWTRDGVWTDPVLASSLAGQRLPARLAGRRKAVVSLLVTDDRSANPQPHARTVPATERRTVREFPGRVGCHL